MFTAIAWAGSWLVGSKTGRLVMTVSLVLAGASLILLQAFRRGQKAEQTKQLQKRLEAVREKVKTDEDIRNLPPHARRERLRDWARD